MAKVSIEQPEALCMTNHQIYSFEDDLNVYSVDDSRIEIIVRD